ncbi:MAG: polysaccharide biosynthesis/export family protein [Thermodesulfobacteriota bacterium]
MALQKGNPRPCYCREKRQQPIITVLAVMVLALSGCKSAPEPAKPLAAEPEGAKPVVTASYLIGMGDELEVLYHIDPGTLAPEYTIDTEDMLRVDFYYYPVMSRTVRVRPDGKITLSPVGDIRAVRKKPTDLALEISERYTSILTRPVITVEVIGFNAKVEDLKRTIYNQERGMSRLAVVRPDGRISLPYIDDIRVIGLTTQELRDRLESRYQKLINNLTLSVVMLRARSNRVYVMGQVERPDFYELPGPITLTQLISMAGGLGPEAETDQVVIIRRKKNGQPDVQMVYLGEVIDRKTVMDPLIQQYDVVYIPRTAIASAALTADALWRIIPLEFNISGVYSLGGKAAQ